MRRAAVAIALAVSLGAAATPSAARVPKSAKHYWRPDMTAARAYASHRAGDISFDVRTEHHVYAFRGTRTASSASVLKAMLLVTYLDHPAVRDRALNSHDASLLVPMIRRSDNQTATRVRNYVGDARLYGLAHRVGMRRFRTAPTWGLSRIDADDQTKFFLHIERFVVARHRATALRLLGSIVPSQRWGIGQVRPPGWALYFKGGWGSGTGRTDHQVALLRRGRMRVAVAILTEYDPSHAYGKETLRGIAARLLRGLDVHAHVR